jgi:hypothetical protein
VDTNLAAVTTADDDYSSYADDAMEVWLDTLHNGGASQGADDYHFFINLHNAVAFFVNDSTPFTHAGFTGAVVLTGTLNTVDTDTGYDLEWSQTWAGMGVTPVSGLVLGFNLSLNQRDDGVAHAQTSWTGAFNTPSLWGTLTLGQRPVAAADEGYVIRYAERTDANGRKRACGLCTMALRAYDSATILETTTTDRLTGAYTLRSLTDSGRYCTRVTASDGWTAEDCGPLLVLRDGHTWCFQGYCRSAAGGSPEGWIVGRSKAHYYDDLNTGTRYRYNGTVGAMTGWIVD